VVEGTRQSVLQSTTCSLVLRVHVPSHKPGSIAVSAQHLPLPTTQPARLAHLEAPVEMLFRVHAFSIALRARHRPVPVTALAQNTARLLRWRGGSRGTRIATGSTRTRRIRPHHPLATAALVHEAQPRAHPAELVLHWPTGPNRGPALD
jgi:hypothetical protein